jgi:hypothetical protein
MSIGASAPVSVEDLYEYLLEQDFLVAGDRRGGMGGVLLTLTGEVPGVAGGLEVWVQISGDRGHWAIALRLAGMSIFVDPQIWAANIDGMEVGDVDVSLQAAFVKERLVEASEALRANPRIELALVRAGEEYMRRKYRLPDDH